MTEIEKFQGLIRKLLQFDLAELDFGMYRLLRMKRDEVEAFISKQLPAEVDKAFAAIAAEELAGVETRVAEFASQVREKVADDAILPSGEVNPQYRDTKVKEARKLISAYEDGRARLNEAQASVADRAEVFNHLFAFFDRYYEDGDFIPKRRYGAREAYAVPYDGSEVFFHWANKDQHYVKTTENLKDYAFTVEGDLTSGGGWRVRFVLVDASVPKDNQKGEDRYFFPRADVVKYDEGKRECSIGFEYRPPTEKETLTYRKSEAGKKPDQEKILAAMTPALLKAVPEPGLRAALAKDRRTDEDIAEEKPELPLLLKRLRHFTRRSTSDYFIHKNLRGFLQQELEFYLKDQVLHVADIDGDFAARRRTIKVMRRLAEQIIQFLAQIEDAQKRLFEKRKFVLETSWLIPIQNVPRDFWPDIIKNKAQLAQWKDWLAIEPEEFLGKKGKVDLSYLEAHPTLVVDTRHFGPAWTRRLLESLPFADLDDATDGLLVHSENLQALSLLMEKYRGSFKCVYIDPPYNTGNDEFIYKDNYQHSSWLAMIEARLRLAREGMRDDGALFVSIDANERDRLSAVADLVFGADGHLNTFVWVNNLKGRQISGRGAAGTHEYVLAYGNTDVAVLSIPISRAKRLMPNAYKGFTYETRHDKGGTYVLKNELHNTNSKFNEETRPNLVFNVHWNPETKEIRFSDVDEDVEYEGFLRVPPKENNDGVHRFHAWRWSKEKISRESDDLEFVTSVDYTRIFTKVRDFESTVLKDVITDVTTEAGSQGLDDCMGGVVFLDYPKPVGLIEVFAGLAGDSELVCDFFAGSGTTGHAVMNLNREDGGRRKFILVEMGEYFDTVMVPRVAKVVFSPEWKAGKPERMVTKEEAERTPRLVKVLRVESYEDALHNIAAPATLERVKEREQAYREVVGDEAYRLRYLVSLPLEASDSMLNIEKLEHPFDYTLEVLTEDGPKQKAVDVIETFNFLYGLRVQQMETWQNDADKVSIGGRLAAPREYRVVKATDREQKRRILVVWRDITDLDPKTDREFLEAKVAELAGRGEAYDERLVNSDCASPSFASLDPMFKRQMCAGESEQGS